MRGESVEGQLQIVGQYYQSTVHEEDVIPDDMRGVEGIANESEDPLGARVRVDLDLDVESRSRSRIRKSQLRGGESERALAIVEGREKKVH